jgi:hypothetical protein
MSDVSLVRVRLAGEADFIEAVEDFLAHIAVAQLIPGALLPTTVTGMTLREGVMTISYRLGLLNLNFNQRCI